ncbi:MAG: outer membrane protein assembly factor BamD [Rickettsiales bacterium]|jgi:outer membrane protein assembly factor BamD|nr:outer membrane protein assembly factor BamD [Rickettsiales bacterium]
MLRNSKFISLCVPLALCACAAAEIDFSAVPDDKIYETGVRHIEEDMYDAAINELKQLEYNYPYSPYVLRSWLALGYAQYLAKKYPDAIETFMKAARIQPGAKEIPYAQYMIAMSFYSQISPINREQRNTESALAAMEKLVREHPEGEYAADVKPKMIEARNTLAAKQMFIARELVRARNYLGALNRYQTVIARYDTTLYAPEALFRTVELYDVLAQRADAGNMLRILELNHPKSEWTAKARRVMVTPAKNNP